MPEVERLKLCPHANEEVMWPLPVAVLHAAVVDAFMQHNTKTYNNDVICGRMHSK